MSSNSQCSGNKELRKLDINEYNKIMEARKKIIDSDDRFNGYTEEKLMKLLGINNWADEFYIPKDIVFNKGGKNKLKTTNPKTLKTKTSKSKSKTKTSKTKTTKNKKNL
jgi:hypothetical protein